MAGITMTRETAGRLGEALAGMAARQGEPSVSAPAAGPALFAVNDAFPLARDIRSGSTSVRGPFATPGTFVSKSAKDVAEWLKAVG